VTHLQGASHLNQIQEDKLMNDKEVTTYILVEDLAGLVAVQTDSIVSRNAWKGDGVTAVLFAFDTGQELSEHTASRPAILHLLEGEARVTLGTDQHQLHAGSWVHMPPNLPHSILAHTPVKMLLLLLGK
jgi:quercetin dioxygenase-like cupin family protein